MNRATTKDAPAFSSYTAFVGHRKIVTGSLPAVALAVKHVIENGTSAPVLIYDDATGRAVEIDTRGTDDEVVARLSEPLTSSHQTRPSGGKHFAPHSRLPLAHEEPGIGEPRGPGRPKLGVIAREVTLLPRHWEWLGTQPGGASVALRKLVEDARRTNGGKDRRRQAHEAAFHFMSSIAGNLPGFEETIRALFADDQPRFSHCMRAWPEDIRAYASRLAFADTTLKTSHDS